MMVVAPTQRLARLNPDSRCLLNADSETFVSAFHAPTYEIVWLQHMTDRCSLLCTPLSRITTDIAVRGMRWQACPKVALSFQASGWTRKSGIKIGMQRSRYINVRTECSF
jgi:hypothetical protein